MRVHAKDEDVRFHPDDPHPGTSQMYFSEKCPGARRIWEFSIKVVDIDDVNPPGHVQLKSRSRAGLAPRAITRADKPDARHLYLHISLIVHCR